MDVELVYGTHGQLRSGGDHVHRAVKFQAAARRSGHLDQQVGDDLVVTLAQRLDHPDVGPEMS